MCEAISKRRGKERPCGLELEASGSSSYRKEVRQKLLAKGQMASAFGEYQIQFENQGINLEGRFVRFKVADHRIRACGSKAVTSRYVKVFAAAMWD